MKIQSLAIALLCATAAVSRAQDSTSQGPVHIAAAVMAANILEHPQPICSPERKGMDISGTVVLDAIIGANGRVVNLNVLSGPEPLRGCVLDAVGEWTYKPYTLNGIPAEVETTITIQLGAPIIGGVAGMVGRPPISPDPYSKPHGPVRVSGGILAGTILNKPMPQCAEVQRTTHVSGAIVLHAIIGTDGHIEKLDAISGPEAIRPCMLETIRRWTYKPYLLNGVPTEVDTTITINMQFGG